jgi:glycosyl transferase family 25
VLCNPFVINLLDRSDRRSEMRRQLKVVGWNAEFFPALKPNNAGNFPSLGARGCFLSHLALLRLAISRQLSSITILEDDVNFCDDFRCRWDNAVSTLSSQRWAIFYAGHVLQEASRGMVYLPHSTPVQCSHFMLINGWALPTLVEGLETILNREPGHPKGGPMHVDGAYSTIRSQNEALKTFASFPPLGYQRSSRSDINEQWFDRIQLLRPLLSVARRIKGRILR